MNRRSAIIISSLLTLLFACAAQIFAHGGFEHVSGTVVKLESSVLSVKTTRGVVAIHLDAKTQITKDSKPAQTSDLKPGVRVVVDVPDENKDSKVKVAHLIKIGAASAADSDAHNHDSHK